MRHAFDADHIAAIDNTTRKLVHEGKLPLSVGFFFSLGHSSVVFALAILLNFGIGGLDEQVKDSSSHLQDTTNIVGTCVSAFFLFLIAAFNVVILAGIVKVFRKMRQGAYDDAALEEQLNKRGLMNRLLGRLARRLRHRRRVRPNLGPRPSRLAPRQDRAEMGPGRRADNLSRLARNAPPPERGSAYSSPAPRRR